MSMINIQGQAAHELRTYALHHHRSPTPVISLIGRPNVGKSTLFNRLQGKQRQAITHHLPGVTRDRNYALITLDPAEGGGEISAILVDTGGFYPHQLRSPGADRLEKERNQLFNIMRQQSQLAVAESDLILLVVDVREGVLPYDREICHYLRASGRPFWVVINKADPGSPTGGEAEFYQLGLDTQNCHVLSAAHGLGVGGLVQALAREIAREHSPAQDLEPTTLTSSPVTTSLCLIGAPNGGKSTLLNRFLGNSRALVSEVAGTTVDPIEDYFTLPLTASPHCTRTALIKVVDTAGIRRKSLVTGYLEQQAVYRALRALSQSAIAICVVDALKGISHQDRRLIDIALDKGVAVIVALNKVDLLPQHLQQGRGQRQWMLDLRAKVPWLDFCTLLTVSAERGDCLGQLKQALGETIGILARNIPTAKLNQVVSGLVGRNPFYPKGGHRGALKVKYATMVKTTPPTILLFSNRCRGIPDPYRRYLQQGIRQAFALKNTPIRLVFRTGERKGAQS